MREKDTYFNDSGNNKIPDSMRQNPYVVPTDFFEQQQKDIFHHISLEKLSLTDFSSDKTMPADYFSTLENNILGKINELKLKEKVNSDGLNIPDDYFVDLNTNIQARISEENLKRKISNHGFEAPDQYFKQLNSSIEAKIAEEKLKSLIQSDGFETPNLYFDDLENDIHAKITINRLLDNESSNSFSVPENYFDNLESKIHQKIKKDSETPVISMKSRKLNWLKYSAAAAILFFGIGTYVSFNSEIFLNQISNTSQVSNVDLKGISDDELINYLAQVSDDDIDLLNLTQIIEEKNTNSVLLESDIKDDDIEEYLNYIL